MQWHAGRWIDDMERFSDQTPTEFREVEARIADWAGRQAVPPGLADRIFDASVGLLPERRGRRLPLPRMPRLWSLSARGGLGGRLALAASIALAFLVAVRVSPRPGDTNRLTPGVETVLLEYAGGQQGFTDSRFAQVEHILMTRDTTFGDLTNDLARVVANLEM
jgi:hypothetical protein